MRRFFILAACCGLFALLAVAEAEEVPIDFAHDIVPIVRVHCGKCHTGDARQGGFSMNTRSSALAGGDSTTPGFVAGQASQSEIIRRIMSSDPQERMPSEGPALPVESIALLRRWIDTQAPWTEGFAFKGTGYESPLTIRTIELPPAKNGRTHPIDRVVDAYWETNSIARPRPSDDRTFMRRVTLDLVGLLPPPQRVKAFVEDTNPAKRAVLVREILAQNLDYAEHWMTFWNDLLRNDYSGTGFITGGRRQITTWLHRSLLENMPYDGFVRHLVSPIDESRGFIDGIVWRGEVNASQIVPIQFAQNISQTFLGINLKCASCHDSFIDRWTLQQTYDLAAIYSNSPLELHRCDKATGSKATPRWLFEEIGRVDPDASPHVRLEQLANLMTSPDNGWLSRTIVNRLWHRLMGRGFVHPVDSMRNRPWNEDLLELLSQHLIEHAWDLKSVLEFIVTSETYAACTPPVFDQAQNADFIFMGPLPKRMTSEQFTDAVWMLTGTAPLKPDAEVVRIKRDKALPALRPTEALWIWSNALAASDPGEKLAFHKQFTLPAAVSHAAVVSTCDNEHTLFLNGKRICAGSEWSVPVGELVTTELVHGTNDVTVVAANGVAGGPAALKVEFHGRLVDGSEFNVHTDDSWEWTTAIPNANGRFPKDHEPGDWKKASVITNQNVWAGASRAFDARLAGITVDGPMPMVRAVLMKGTSLMAALGRPNRDQVVTSRPVDLTTLEAIQLANEPSLADEFARGSRQILDQHGPQADALLRWMFEASLSRSPTSEETASALEMLGEKPTAESIADCLWAIVMLPEFQLIR